MPLSKEQLDFILRRLPPRIDVQKVQVGAAIADAIRTELEDQKSKLGGGIKPVPDDVPVEASVIKT